MLPWGRGRVPSGKGHFKVRVDLDLARCGLKMVFGANKVNAIFAKLHGHFNRQAHIYAGMIGLI